MFITLFYFTLTSFSYTVLFYYIYIFYIKLKNLAWYRMKVSRWNKKHSLLPFLFDLSIDLYMSMSVEVVERSGVRNNPSYLHAL